MINKLPAPVPASDEESVAESSDLYSSSASCPVPVPSPLLSPEWSSLRKEEEGRFVPAESESDLTKIDQNPSLSFFLFGSLHLYSSRLKLIKV